MNSPRGWMVALAVLVAGGARAEPPPTEPILVPPRQCSGCAPADKGGLFAWSRLHERDVCQPECCAYSHLLCPFEVYVRTGPALIAGSGRLDEVLQTGYSVAFGAKAFDYDGDGSGAWTGHLGIDYIYNNSNDKNRTPVRTLPATLRELHRFAGYVAGGREWYWDQGYPESARWLFGVDVGGRLGHARGRFNRVDRRIPIERRTDTFEGFVVGVDAGVLIPRCGYDLTFGGRFEWGHDYFQILDLDDNVGQMKLLLSAGLRY